MLYATGAVFILLGVFVVYKGLKRGELRSDIARLPTSNIADVGGVGQVEIKGRVVCDNALTAPHTRMECVHYNFELQHRERTRTNETGRARYRWVTVDEGTASVPFLLQDESGAIRVDPTGAEIDAPVVAKQSVAADAMTDVLGEQMGGILNMMAAFRGPQRVIVRAIRPHDSLYVLGAVQPTGSGGSFVGLGVDKFFISTRSEAQINRRLMLRSFLAYGSGALLIAAGLAVVAKGAQVF